MEYLVHRIFLDMHTVSSQVSIRVKKADTGRKIYITLRENGKPYQIADDCYAVFSARKPDGNYIYNACQIEGNTIIYTFTEQTVPVVGFMECEVILYDDEDQVITSPRFSMIVEDRVYNGEEIVSSTEADALNELTERAKAAAIAAENVVGDIRSHVDNNFANALNGNADGALVQVDDISPIEHTVGCRVRSRNLYNNLLDYAKTQETEWTYDSVTGTLYVAYYYINKFIALEEGETYTLSYKSTKTGGEGGGIYIRAYNKEKNQYEKLNLNSYTLSNTVTFTMPEGYPNLRITFYGDTAASTYSATYTNLMLEKGTEATGYVPYVDPAAVTVTRCGKNLIPFFTSAYAYTYRNVVHTCDTVSNTIKMNGTAEAGGGRTIFSKYVKPIRLVKGVTYTLQAKLISGVGTEFHCYLTGTEAESKVIAYCLANSSATFTASEDLECFVGVNQVEGITYENAVVQFQLEVGNTATSLETYKGAEYTSNADGTVDGMTSLYPYMAVVANTANTLVSCKYTKDSNKVIKELYDYINYLTSTVTKITHVKLFAANWEALENGNNLYSQIVSIDGVTENSQVDLTPDVEQLAIFYEKDLAFVTENVEGVVTVYAIGQKPKNDYIIQAKITEVNV